MGTREAKWADPVRLSGDGRTFDQPVAIAGAGAFGDVVNAPITPMCQRDFAYGGHADEIYEYEFGTGTIAYSNSMAVLSTGASQYGTAFMRTSRHVRYRPGQGALFRFTALFDSPVVGLSQVAGAFGGSENGLFVGYDYTDASARFGVCRQHSGARDIHTLTIATPAGGAETLTVTLNGSAEEVSITAGTAAENAQEVVAHYAGVVAWIAEASGATVRFLANNVGPRNGAYSVSSSGSATGSIASNLVGVAVVEDWVYQENFNADTIDGTGPSGMTIDPTKGNVFEIKMQYLGFGAIDFMVEEPDTGKFILCHRYRYANSDVTPSSGNPIYALGGAISAIGGVADATIKMGSVAGFVEGAVKILGPDHGVSVDGAIGATTESPIISIRVNDIFIDAVARVNLRDIMPTVLAMSGSGSNKPIKGSLVLNGTLTDPLWTDYATTHSYAAYDVSATGITGGDTLAVTSMVGAGGSAILDLTAKSISVRPGDTLTIVMETTGTAADYLASIAWKEDS